MNNCKKCGIKFNTQKGLINFCSLTCRNSRERSDVVKEKIRNSVCNFNLINPGTHLGLSGNLNPNWKGGDKEILCKCKICLKEFKSSKFRLRKTCSRECQILASTSRKYQNGSRKTINYNGIILESSWELKVAKLLDRKTIIWERPKPIGWVDSKNKSHFYYPDFYIPSMNMYLDPKNPYCMKKDLEKMEIISKSINIIYGDINKIIEFIENKV